MIGIVTALANPSQQGFFVGIGFAVPDRHRRRRRRRPVAVDRTRRQAGRPMDPTRRPAPTAPMEQRSTRSRRSSSGRTSCWSGCSSRCWRAAPARRGRAGAGQDDGDQDAGAGDRRAVPADPVHPRPGARRHRRHPDLQPAGGEFQVSLGPVFTNLLLADEINRAPAKVQSALLEVMQERQVTIGRETLPGARPVPRDGDAEPDRVGGHLPAARGPARPVHAQGAGRLPDAHRGVRHRRADDRGRSRPPAAGDRRRRHCWRSSAPPTRSTSTPQ